MFLAPVGDLERNESNVKGDAFRMFARGCGGTNVYVRGSTTKTDCTTLASGVARFRPYVE